MEKDADPKNLPINAKAVIIPFRSILTTKSKFPKLVWDKKTITGVAYYSTAKNAKSAFLADSFV